VREGQGRAGGDVEGRGDASAREARGDGFPGDGAGRREDDGAVRAAGEDASQPGEREGPEAGESDEKETRLRGPWWFTRARQLTEEQRHNLLAQLYFTGIERRHFLGRFVVLLSIAALIATFGLASDSPSVVIGAMLVSPMTTPLLGLAASLVMGWPKRQIESILIIIGASFLGIGLGWLALKVIPEPSIVTLSSQVLIKHTEPGLIDLGVALVAGAAGAYVLVRREAIGALPGVAIAVALVPPMATTGMMLELGEPERAKQALLLYATNLAGIILSASVVLLLSGVRHPSGVVSNTTTTGIVIALVAVVAVTVPLAGVTHERVVDTVAYDRVASIADDWFEGTSVHVRDVEVDTDTRDEVQVFLELEGPQRPLSFEGLADRIARELGEPVNLEADWIRAQRFEQEAEPSAAPRSTETPRSQRRALRALQSGEHRVSGGGSALRAGQEGNRR